MADKRAIWGLGILEAEVSRIGRKFSRSRVKSWDVAFAAGLTVACLLSYEVITLLIAHCVSRGDGFLGGMWATVATIFVFRRAGTGELAAGVARFVATCVSRPATAQAPGLAAPFCACSRDVGADGGAVGLSAASAWKNASNTPLRLSRENLFHTVFQGPYSAGSARQDTF